MKNYEQEIRGEIIPDLDKLHKAEENLAIAQNKFLNIFEPQDRDYIKSHTYFAGGCIYSIYNNQRPKDYDIFCDSLDIVEFISQEIDSLEKLGIVQDIFITSNAISINDYSDYNFQIIKKFYGEPSGVIAQFDFYHNFFAFINGKIISFHNWRYIETKKLCFNFDRARDIGNVILRIPKFVERGFKIYKSDHAKILLMALENASQEIESLKSEKEHY
jgi:hypothetical protein